MDGSGALICGSGVLIDEICALINIDQNGVLN